MTFSTVKNKAIVELIVCLLSAFKSSGVSETDKRDLMYLLNQTIRTYNVDGGHLHVSEAAKALWEKLTTSKNIFDFHYKDVVVCDKLNGSATCEVEVYKGSSKTWVKRVLKNSERFFFREVFHEDHVVPVAFIIDDLLRLNVLDKKSVENVLDKIHVCVLLKKEDRKVGRTKGRTDEYSYVIDNVYKPNGIIIK